MSSEQGLDADDVIEALLHRHPAYEPGMTGVGRWTTLREWCNVDLLALDAWQAAEVVGYEVKVSRSDMRSELLNPTKRSAAVAMCTRFYFAIPAGLLTPEERAFEEPDWAPADFVRPQCTNPDCRALGRYRTRGFASRRPKPRGPKLRGTAREGVSIDLGHVVDAGVDGHGGTYSHTVRLDACCTVCRGYGTSGKSRVEQEAPTLWVPKDVGLVVVGSSGTCTVLKQAPRRKVAEPILPWPFTFERNPRYDDETASRIQRQSINVLARWVSARPDPRHRRADPYADTVD